MQTEPLAAARARLAETANATVALIRRADRPVLVGFAAATLATLVFAQIYDEVDESDLMVRLDQSASTWISDWRGGGLTGLMRVATILADPWFVVAATTLVTIELLVRRRRGAALFLVAATVGTSLLVMVAKLATGRDRPVPPISLMEVDGYSFPSGHAAQSVALYGALAIIATTVIVDRRKHVVVYLTALGISGVVGISRVVLGVHWLSDVVGGWLLAAAWLATLATGRRALLLRSEANSAPPAPD